MNAKRAKAIRNAILPGREETGMSRGAFLRTLTQYTESNVRKYVLEYPPEKEEQWDGTIKLVEPEPFEYIKSTVRLDENCPRGLYKKFKRIANGKRS